MNPQHLNDPFDTICWMYEPAASPCQVFAHCFAEAHVHEFCKLVKKLMNHAAQTGVYKAQPREDVLLCRKLIRSLIKAAYHLRYKKRRPVVMDEGDLFNKKYYLSHYVSADVWKEFPRHLSKKEYRNPYLAFKKFYSYQPLTNWVQCWEQMADCALCGDDVFVPPAPLKVYSYLAKLIEAAHLVNVREVANVNACLKALL